MNVTKCGMLLKLVLIFCQTLKVFAWLETPHWYNEYFGDGDFHEESADQIKKHLSRQDLKHKDIQWAPLNGITLGPRETDSYIRLILISEQTKHTLGRK
jgi:hypothetical protein